MEPDELKLDTWYWSKGYGPMKLVEVMSDRYSANLRMETLGGGLYYATADQLINPVKREDLIRYREEGVSRQVFSPSTLETLERLISQMEGEGSC